MKLITKLILCQFLPFKSYFLLYVKETEPTTEIPQGSMLYGNRYGDSLLILTHLEASFISYSKDVIENVFTLKRTMMDWCPLVLSYLTL